MRYTAQDRLEAAHWFLDIHDVEDPSPEMLQEWGRWVDASDGHRLAFAAVESAWHDAPATVHALASPASDRDDDEYDATVSIHEWQTRRNGQPLHSRRSPSAPIEHRWRRRLVGLATAAAIGATALLLLPRVVSHLSPNAGSTEFATRTGEHMQVTLADGSQVNLGARSRLSVQYTPSGRDVRLEVGEGFFAVQKDASRPFRVHVLNGIVTAVGTAFDVRTANDRVVVAVAEGTVQVTGADAPQDSTVTVSSSAPRSNQRASHGARITRGESISFVSRPAAHVLEPAAVIPVDPAQPARWREGWLVYRDEPLRDVLADIGRYTDHPIIVDAAVPVAPHFTGAVFKDSVVEWLESLPNAFPVTVKTDGERIVIAPASGSVLARDK
jgi:transmembrane sensor